MGIELPIDEKVAIKRGFPTRIYAIDVAPPTYGERSIVMHMLNVQDLFRQVEFRLMDPYDIGGS